MRRMMTNLSYESDNLIIRDVCTDGEQMPDGRKVTPGTLLVTPYFDLTPGKYYTNLSRNIPSGVTWSQYLYLYDANQKNIAVQQLSENRPYGEIYVYEIRNEETRYGRIVFDISNENPYYGKSGRI